MDSLSGSVVLDVKGHSLTKSTSVSLSTTTVKFGSGALNWPSTSGFVNVAASADWVMTADFTIECWAYWDTNASAMTCFNLPGVWDVYRNNTGQLQLYRGSNVISSAANAVALNVWHHIALTRSGSTVSLWLNGVLVGTYSFSGTVGANAIWAIGAFDNTQSDPMRGFIDEFRLTKGVARYTSAFTPPTAAFPGS